MSGLGRGEHGWMIEHIAEPMWWTGVCFDIRQTEAWSKDPNAGVRFTSATDASVVAMALHRELPAEERKWRRNQTKTTAHEWPGEASGLHPECPRERHAVRDAKP